MCGFSNTRSATISDSTTALFHIGAIHNILAMYVKNMSKEDAYTLWHYLDLHKLAEDEVDLWCILADDHKERRKEDSND